LILAFQKIGKGKKEVNQQASKQSGEEKNKRRRWQ